MADPPIKRSTPTGSSVDDRLGLDHERLGALLENLRQTLEARRGEAGQVLGSLKTALLVHMEWEEKILFPSVRARVSARSQRSIESLEIDHERLRDTLESLESTVAAGDFGAAGTLLRWLETLLRGHNYDEEHGVYVEADRLLETEERRALLESFEKASGGRKT